VAMAYLRVITGAGDGKMRIWHMVDATCLRIIRGNSRSDPITQLIATHNRYGRRIGYGINIVHVLLSN
jgi:hypothetical protein